MMGMFRTFTRGDYLDFNLNYIKPLYKILNGLIGLNKYLLYHCLSYDKTNITINVFYQVEKDGDKYNTYDREIITEFPVINKDNLYYVRTNNFESISNKLKKQIENDILVNAVVCDLFKPIPLPPSIITNEDDKIIKISKYKKATRIVYECPKRLQIKLNRLIALGFDINNTIDLEGYGTFEEYVNS
jgi:hypothetical protein